MIASVAGIIRVCMMQQCHPTNMLGMEMNIVAGVVLGGTAIVGGKGTLTGCVLGTLLIVLVENSMSPYRRSGRLEGRVCRPP